MTTIQTTSRRPLPSKALCLFFFWLAWVLAAAPAAGVELELLEPGHFPLPESLHPNVAFWIDIFSHHESNHLVLHDEKHLQVVYATLDLSELESSGISEVEKRRRRREAVESTVDRYKAMLRHLAAGEAPRDAEERRLEAAFRSVPGGDEKYRQALDRFRTQSGLADHFAEAIGRSGRYLAAIEEIFQRHGLPRDLTRLPFVESMFQEGARSKVAAGGIWQIMPASGRPHLEIGYAVDERYDPLRATEAAATLLKENYEALGTWPLAVTAYNYGKNGLRRAVQRLGTTDIGVITARHRTRVFGFASRNFYSEFLAAAHIYNRREHFFPDARPEPPLAFDLLALDRYAPAGELARRAGRTVEELAALNPAVSREVWRGGLLLPRGYSLRVPAGSGGAFEAAYLGMPSHLKPEHQIGSRYRVRPGDTLSGIARRFGTSVSALQRANGLARRHLIRVGQILRIPAGASWPASAAAPPGVHVVRRGETLSSIAGRYGVSVEALMVANGIRNKNRIYVGQRLAIPG